MTEDPFANLLHCKVTQQEEPQEPPRAEEEGGKIAIQETDERTHEEGQEEKGTGGKNVEEGTAGVAPGRRRRSSRVLGPDAAGCYLSFDQLQKKWVGLWSATVIADVVAYLRPKVKVPQYKYVKKEKVIFKSEAAADATRDERKDFFRGLCLFVKLAKEVKGEFLLISKADLDERGVRLFALTDEKEVKALDTEDVYYDASNLKAAAVVTSSPTSVYRARTMDLPTFVAEAGKEGGTAISFEG